MNETDKRVLTALLDITSAPIPQREIIDQSLSGYARKREGQRIEHQWAEIEAAEDGYFPTARLPGSPMARSRAVARLIKAGLVEAIGLGKGRMVRITAAGRRAAEAM
jgi:hypothetical protein